MTVVILLGLPLVGDGHAELYDPGVWTLLVLLDKDDELLPILPLELVQALFSRQLGLDPLEILPRMPSSQWFS